MSKTYVELDPEIAARLVEGYEDVLAGERLKQEAFYRQFNCPRCGGSCAKHFLSIEHAFPGDEETLIPRSGLKCRMCSCVFDPHSGIIVALGNPGEINERLRAMGVPSVGGED